MSAEMGKPIVFANVLGFRQDLKIPGDMQSAHERALQGHDVIDFMANARLARQSVCVAIDLINCRLVYPSWRCLELARHSLRIQSETMRRICTRPSFVGLAFALFIGGTPFRIVSLFVCSILTIPLRMCVGIRESKSHASFVGTWPTGVRKTIGRCSAHREVAVGFRRLTDITSLQLCRTQCRAVRALSRERGIPQPRPTGFANVLDTECTTSGSLASDPTTRIKVVAMLLYAARATRLAGHFVFSICRSMMRRTSSAMEIPSRFASRLRNVRCGSVNEIICFVIPLRIPQGIPVGQCAA